MSASLVPVDTLLSPLKLTANDVASKAENKLFLINRVSANNRAEKQHYGTVGVNAYTEKGEKKENTPNTSIRLIHKAFEDYWTVPAKKAGKEDGGATYQTFFRQKRGPGVVFIASVPLADFVAAFPNHFGPAADPANDGKSVNIYLSSQFEDVVKALRVSHFIPAGASEVAANDFVRRHSFSLQEVARVIDGVENPNFNAEKRAGFDELVTASKAAKEAHVKPVPQGINVGLFNGALDVAVNIRDAYQRAPDVAVLDVNGSHVCFVGEEPTKNIKNIVSDALDNIPLANLDEAFTKKTMKVSGLVPVGSGGYALVPRPTDAAATSKSKHFPLNLSVTFHDKEGKAHVLPIDFFRSDNAHAAGILVGELKAAKRNGVMIYSVDPSAADAAVIAIARREEDAKNKTTKSRPAPRTAKNIFATKK